MVIYTKVSWNNKELLLFHNAYYHGINYFVENEIDELTFETTIVVVGFIKGRKITKYDEYWRENIEYTFDEHFQLIEYRQFYYELTARAPIREKIFFASSWHISEEKYD